MSRAARLMASEGRGVRRETRQNLRVHFSEIIFGRRFRKWKMDPRAVT